MTSLETVCQVCLTVYQAIASVQQQHPDLLNEKYRSLPLQQPGYQASFTDRLSSRLSKLSDQQAIASEVEATLRILFTPEFFQTANFQALMVQVAQTIEPPPELPPPPEPVADPPINPVEQNSDAIALLLLDAENFQPDIDTERFLAASCTYPLQVKIAFANWRSLGKKDIEFHNRHYDLMHVPGGKDMADGKMIAVGSSIHEHYPLVKEVLVCSSDQVMTNLCTKLRQRGLIVYQVRKQKDGGVTILNSHTNETRKRPNLPTVPPLETCIAQLKDLIRSEQQQSGQTWVPLAKILQRFQKQHKFSIDQVLAAYSPTKQAEDLFLERPGDFAMHQPPNQEIHVSLFQVSGGNAVPSSAHNAITKEQGTPAANLTSKVKASTLTNSPEKTKAKAPIPSNKAQLEAALVEIVKEATANVAGGYIDISTVGSHFHQRYQQSITTVIKQLNVKRTFPNFLDDCKMLKVQQKGKVWQVGCR